MKRSLLSADSLTTWASENSIMLNGMTISTSPSGHGTGLIATQAASKPGSIFVEVPHTLLLNCSLVWALSASDPDLAAILGANEDLAKTTRGAILIFLLMQITHSSPDILESGYERLPIGKSNVFSEYIQYIQTEQSLPLFWPKKDISHLWGTSLERHHAAKVRFLKQEYELFKDNCQNLPWSKVWFGEEGCLVFEDWLTVDAMWRSRAMDLSSTDHVSEDKGSCLVPIMDMANHTTDGIAAYKLFTSSNGSPCARLVLEKVAIMTDDPDEGNLQMYGGERIVDEGDEITISYGSTKGAAEMIFSYGFLDDNLSDARSMMLGWNLPEDDPLRFEKMTALKLEPGIQIYTPVMGSKSVRFVSTAVWAMSINEEDGLRIVAQQRGDESATDANMQLESPQYKMFFKDTLITSKSQLMEVLTHDRAALIFRTRAYAYVYLRIEEELVKLEAKIEECSELSTEENETESPRATMCAKLRESEYMLLHRASTYFSNELARLTQHPDVIQYPDLLAKGLSLPPLSQTELWDRYEAEHDEDNRHEYVRELESVLDSLTNADLGFVYWTTVSSDNVRSSEDWTGWKVETENQKEDDIIDELDTSATDFMRMERDEDLFMAHHHDRTERWYYDMDGKIRWSVDYEDDDPDLDEEKEQILPDSYHDGSWLHWPDSTRDNLSALQAHGNENENNDVPMLDTDEDDKTHKQASDTKTLLQVEPITPSNESNMQLAHPERKDTVTDDINVYFHSTTSNNP